MAMQASTLRILEAANFSTPQALALGQAIDEEIEGAQKSAQFVTVPLLDVRLAELKLQISGLESGLESKIFGVESRLRIEMSELEARMSGKMMTLGLSATGIIITAVFFIVLNLRR